MRKLTDRRFGVHEVTKGKLKGSLLVATSANVTFLGQLSYLDIYLNSHLLPQEPEEVLASRIILNLQNVLGYELELVITDYINANMTEKNKSFLWKINSGFVNFKTKFQWAFTKKLIMKNEWDVMEQIRSIRNEQIHARPKTKRIKYKYFDKQLLTRSTILHLFTDVNNIVLRLRSLSGSKEKWPVIPPGYAEEMGWYEERQVQHNT